MGYYFALNQSEEKLKHINRDEQTAVGLFYSSKQMARIVITIITRTVPNAKRLLGISHSICWPSVSHDNGGGNFSFDIFMWEGNSGDLALQEITQ